MIGQNGVPEIRHTRFGLVETVSFLGLDVGAG